MALLHLFMLMLFIIGVLLIVVTFGAYGQLDETCTSINLRNKLRWAILTGTVLITMSIGYMICVKSGACDCKFGERSNWKTNTMLVTLMGMGVGLLILTIGIKNDLNKGGCTVDLGTTTDILTGISIAQIVIPLLYIIYIIRKGDKGDKKDKEDHDPEDHDPEDHEIKMLLQTSKQLELDKKNLNEEVLKLNKQLTKQKEKYSSKKNDTTKDNITTIEYKIKARESKIKDISKKYSKIQSQISSGSISGSDSDKSSNPWGINL